LEIANVSETPLTLYPGLSVAQLIFSEVEGAECPPNELSGSYVGPVRPETPVLKPPQDALQELNVPEEHIYIPWPPWRWSKWRKYMDYEGRKGGAGADD
jgi:hypothetical protein